MTVEPGLDVVFGKNIPLSPSVETGYAPTPPPMQ
jgi:hypothetical protein